jgi:tetratricopeptide (TPR) repeat protein
MSGSCPEPESPLLHEELKRLFAERHPDAPTKIASLARLVNASKSSVYAYFKGETVPSAEGLDDLLSALRVQDPAGRRRFHELRDEAAARKRGADSAGENLQGQRDKSASFIGRDLTFLARLVDNHGQVAVHGGGGTGKTEYALQYAHAYRQSGQRRVAWWIDAGSPRQITAGLAELARRVYSKPPRIDAVAAERAVNWLRSNQQWLVVFDNVTDLADVTGILSEVRGCGSVVLTTRLDVGQTGWSRSGLHPLPLGPLDRAASVELLLVLAASTDRAGARLLAEEAGDLPLALSQAAAFVAEHPETGFREYRLQLADRLDRLAASASAGGRSGLTVAATWAIAMDRASAAAPLSTELMPVLSYLDGRPLPEDTLELLGDPADVGRALDSLAAYRVIHRSEGEITAHRLVQAAARMADPRPAEHRAAAVALLDRGVPPEPLVDPAGWPRWRALAPHIETLTARLPEQEQSEGSVRLRERYATFLQGQGNVTRAITLFESVVADSLRVLGRTHPDTRGNTANLAVAYVAAARITPAVAVFEELLPRYREALGPADQETLQIQALLADAYRLRGHPDTAAGLLEQVVADAEGSGLDDGTAQTLLASALADAGRLDEAIGLLEQVYAQQSRSLGASNMKTLVSRHNLARARREAGQADEAMSEFQEILAIQGGILGANHPYTLQTRGNLALTEQARGLVDKAIAEFDALLIDTQEELGREHPASLITLRYLAAAYLANDEVGEAIPLLEQAVAEHQRLLGGMEPLTFLARRDLAAAYQRASELAYGALLDDQEQVLGPQHPQTAVTRTLASRPRADGRAAGAWPSS